MSKCNLCSIFETGESLVYTELLEERFLLNRTIVCKECKDWLNRMLSVRSRYVQMVKEVANY